MERAERNPFLIYSPRLFFGLGGAGVKVARLARELVCREIFKRLTVGGDDVQQTLHDLAVLCGFLGMDSEAPEPETYSPTFAGEPELPLPLPEDFVLLTSYSGSELIERAKTEPFAHLARATVPLSEIEGKRSQSEAQQNRLFGATNVQANIYSVAREIGEAVERCYGLEKSPAWLRLTAHGLTLNPKLPVIHVFFSSAGGQGSGAILPALALLALALEDRSRPRIYVHWLIPGFHPSSGEFEELNNKLRTQAVFQDLAAIKHGSEMHIPFPQGDKTLRPRHGRELFDALFIHEPLGDRAEAYENFVRRVSRLVMSLELGAFARDAARSRSNVPQFAIDQRADRRTIPFEGVRNEGD
jgi:hypothetical protein